MKWKLIMDQAKSNIEYFNIICKQKRKLESGTIPGIYACLLVQKNSDHHLVMILILKTGFRAAD